MTSSGKNGLNIRRNASPKWDRTRCPEEKTYLTYSYFNEIIQIKSSCHWWFAVSSGPSSCWWGWMTLPGSCPSACPDNWSRCTCCWAWHWNSPCTTNPLSTCRNNAGWRGRCLRLSCWTAYHHVGPGRPSLRGERMYCYYAIIVHPWFQSLMGRWVVLRILHDFNNLSVISRLGSRKSTQVMVTYLQLRVVKDIQMSKIGLNTDKDHTILSGIETLLNLILSQTIFEDDRNMTQK